MTIRLRRGTAAAVVAVVVLLTMPAAVHALPGAAPTETAPGRLELPRPTGPYPVGAEVLHLTDHDRTDPWAPTATARELMVSLRYPARGGSGGGPAAYMSTEEARLMLAGRGLGDDAPAEVSSAVTHAGAGATGIQGRFPLVLLSPGLGNHRATLTSLAEDLASRGYVVASVDHAYESTGTVFPGGRMLTCRVCELLRPLPVEEGHKLLKAVSTGRADDLSFVLNRLTGHRPAWHNSRMIDPHRIAVVGHSMGGNAAASAMLGDRRFDAGINMDGVFYDRIPAAGVDGRPFLMLGNPVDHHPGGPDSSWDEGWQGLDGPATRAAQTRQIYRPWRPPRGGLRNDRQRLARARFSLPSRFPHAPATDHRRADRARHRPRYHHCPTARALPSLPATQGPGTSGQRS
ncbi:alpha/beta hydrolase [Streptomyces pratensis]|nr:alpha/beta hydrolase [Streptomyces pratensis]